VFLDPDYSDVQSVGVAPVIPEPLAEQMRENQKSFVARSMSISSLRGKISEFRVTVTGPGILIPLVQTFPSTTTEGVIRVESGKSRVILIEGVGVDMDGSTRKLVSARTVVDLEPAIQLELGVPGSKPIEFELIDTISPITAIFHSGSGLVEGPHRQTVDIILSNFETADLYYRVSEKDKPLSTLRAVTSGWQTAISTVTVRLEEEGTYLFEYYSQDSASNQEPRNEKEVVVNFNQNPPVTQMQYSGWPYKIFAGSRLGLAIEMASGQTGLINYQLGSEEELKTANLKRMELASVTVGTQGIVPNVQNLTASPPVPAYKLDYYAEILDGSVEAEKRSTDLYLTDMVVGGEIVTTFEAGSTGVYAAGFVPFCDTDSSSIYVDPTGTCGTQGKLVNLQTGPFSPGVAADYSCLKTGQKTVGGQTVATIEVVSDSSSCSVDCDFSAIPEDDAEAMAKQQEKCRICVSRLNCVDCATYKKATGVDCP
jgi:hypothetical protein